MWCGVVFILLFVVMIAKNLLGVCILTMNSFEMSLKLSAGKQEISTYLPYGRYLFVLNTNLDDRAFSTFTPTRQYQADVTFVVVGDEGEILHNENPNSGSFLLKDSGMKKIRFLIDVQNLKKEESVYFNLKRTY